MKKWYKGYLDAQKKAQPQSEGSGNVSVKPAGRASGKRQISRKFRDPVAVGKRTRSKTFGAS